MTDRQTHVTGAASSSSRGEAASGSDIAWWAAVFCHAAVGSCCWVTESQLSAVDWQRNLATTGHRPPTGSPRHYICSFTFWQNMLNFDVQQRRVLKSPWGRNLQFSDRHCKFATGVIMSTQNFNFCPKFP